MHEHPDRGSAKQLAGTGGLLEAALTRKNLQTAWKRVKANRGGAGVYGLDIEQTAHLLQTSWPDIRQALRAGSYSIAVDTKYLLTDGDTTLDASVTGTGGSTAKAVQNYGLDNVVPATLSLNIDLDNGAGMGRYSNDGYINSLEKGSVSTTSLTASFDSSKASLGDVITFSDGSLTKQVVLDQDMLNKGLASSGDWKLPSEGGATQSFSETHGCCRERGLNSH